MKRHAAEIRHRKLATWIVLAAILLGIGAIRWRMLGVPFERDEGEYAYAARLFLQGVPPYADVYTMKLPGMFLAYAGIMSVGGESIEAIHAGLLVVNAATIVLVFLLARRLLGAAGALTAAATFGLLALSRAVLGFTANAEHFVILFAIGALLWLANAVDHRRVLPLAGPGVLLGLAFLMKQHGVFFVGFALAWIVASQWRGRRTQWRRIAAQAAIVTAGAALPFAVTCATLWAIGAFDRFWFWTYTYASEYAAQIELVDGIRIMLRKRAILVLSVLTPAWMLVGAGLVSVPWSRSRGFLTLFTLFSFAAVCPGYFFREHYFVLLAPAAALLAGAAVDAGERWLGVAASRIVVVAALVLSLAQERAFLFRQGPDEILAGAYGNQPYVESVKVAEYIRENTSEDDRIAVLGSEPQIYFYARRRAVTPYIYTYPMMESHPFAEQMQLEMIRDVETAQPPIIVFAANHASWLPQPGAPKRMTDWTPGFIESFYEQVGVTDRTPQGPIYLWGADARNYGTRTTGLLTFRRKP